MKAVIKKERKEGFTWEDVDEPVPKKNEVLVKTQRVSVCGTDLHMYNWDEWSQNRVKPPLVVGHELAGKVVETGENVSSLKEGDFVSAETHIACGKCFQCKTGGKHVCEKVEILGVDRDGCFTDYVVMPEENAWKNDERISLDVASVQEPFGNAVHTAMECVLKDGTVLVTGCGPIGCFAVGIARACGAAKVIASDVNEYRLGLAQKMGADIVVDARKQDLVKECHNATNGRGVDVVLEMSGNPSAIIDGFKALRARGEFSFLGIPKKPFEFDFASLVVFKSARVYGINGRKMFATWEKTRELLAEKKVDVSPVLTHSFKLEEFDEAMQLMRTGNCGKIILVP